MPTPAWAPARGTWSPALAAASRELRRQITGQRTFVVFALSVGAVNVTSLLGNALAFRWIDPASMGVWHTLLLLSSYLSVVRLGLINGLGRELPFALGGADLDRARRIAATGLAYDLVCGVIVGFVFTVLLAFFWRSGPAWRLALPAMAVMGATSFYLAHLQATFRSDSEFGRLSRVFWIQAGTGLLLPFFIYALGFAGLCLHAALQMVIVTAFAHATRPFRVRPRFEPALARELMTTGLPLFATSYLQILATGFDRVILLHRGNVETVGYYAPAMAVLAAMAIVPGAISTYVYPRMSYALGQGRLQGELRAMALRATAASVAAGLPVAVAGWFAAPAVIERFFPRYLASIPAVRWSLLAGLLWSVAPAASLLGSLKDWRRLSLYVACVVVMRWTLPWWFSQVYPPLEGVARGNVGAAAVCALLSLWLVRQVTDRRGEEAAT